MRAPPARRDAMDEGLSLPTGPRAPRKRWGTLALVANLLLIAAAGAALVAWLLWPTWRLLGQVDALSFGAPSRLYGRPAVISVADPLPPRSLEGRIEDLGYARVPAGGAVAAGRFSRDGSRLTVHLRSFPSATGLVPSRTLDILFRGDRVASLRLDGSSINRAVLEPPLLATFYGPDRQERRPARLGELSDDLVRAVLAAEDDGFFQHAGVSLSGVLRAAWSDLRGGAIRQGGSTLTQQLVKNLYLSNERTLARKLREVILTFAVEAQFSKREILEAYLNCVYLGARDGVNIMGVGAAARAWFGKDAGQLTLAEAATVAGMIASPAAYSPVSQPQRCLDRRNGILRRLDELGWISHERVAAALAEPLAPIPAALDRRRAPYFAEAARREAAERFGVTALEDQGYVLLSTLDIGDQMAAELAVERGLADLESGWERRRRAERLQAALISVDARSGDVLAWVGGRDWEASQFDRVSQARRQAGSAFKPVVYAAAFARGVLTPASTIDDAPLTLVLAGQEWAPRNDDGRYLGAISVRTALEQSRNLPAVRAALRVGLPEVMATARRLGVVSPLQGVPSLALGAFELSPLEMATVYATLANGGLRPPVHGLVAVLDPAGARVTGRGLSLPVRALPAPSAYLLTAVLQGVIERGTGIVVRRAGIGDPVAGKTGTTNERRDSWFCGYSPDRATVVWVGYDANTPTRLSGARAAAPLWARFAAAVRPAGGYQDFTRPAGIVTAVIDPVTGELATSLCPSTIREVFPEALVPRSLCHLHGGRRASPVPQPDGVEPPEGGRFTRWVRRVFGRKRNR